MTVWHTDAGSTVQLSVQGSCCTDRWRLSDSTSPLAVSFFLVNFPTSFLPCQVLNSRSVVIAILACFVCLFISWWSLGVLLNLHIRYGCCQCSTCWHDLMDKRSRFLVKNMLIPLCKHLDSPGLARMFLSLWTVSFFPSFRISNCQCCKFSLHKLMREVFRHYSQYKSIKTFGRN